MANMSLSSPIRPLSCMCLADVGVALEMVERLESLYTNLPEKRFSNECILLRVSSAYRMHSYLRKEVDRQITYRLSLME